jgi:FixJ family two-component response regulator
MNNNQSVIAVVDDEEAICKGLERLLRSAGYTAKTFLQGAISCGLWKMSGRIVWYWT